MERRTLTGVNALKTLTLWEENLLPAELNGSVVYMRAYGYKIHTVNSNSCNTETPEIHRSGRSCVQCEAAAGTQQSDRI